MSDRPVILLAIKGLGIGGAEKLISEAIPFWDQETYDYQVCYFLPWKDQLVAEMKAQGVTVTLVGGPRGLDWGAPRRFRKLIAESDAALVHVHSPAVGVLARVVSPVPTIYTEHNVVDSYRQPTRSLNKLSYRRNAATIAVSDAVAESVRTFAGPPATVIRNGVACHVTEDERAAVRAELAIDNDRPLVVHVGNIRPFKGHRNLISATKLFRESIPDVLVVSVGVEKNPGDLQKLVDESAAQGISSSIRFMGRRPDARAFLAAADVVVNPSDVEGLPIVVLEAMALGQPIVATDVGGVPTVIIDEHTGLLVPAADPAALAEGVVKLMSDKSLAAGLGRSAAETVEREYGLEGMVHDVEAVYAKVIHG